MSYWENAIFSTNKCSYCHLHSLKELEKEINTLETDLEELKDEVSYHNGNLSYLTYEPDDRFLVIMEPFLQEVTQSFDKKCKRQKLK